MRTIQLASTLALLVFSSPGHAGEVPSAAARPLADFALETYGPAAIETLRDLVAFETVHQQGQVNSEGPPFQAMTAYLKDKATELGLDFTDYGQVVVIGLGQGPERLGIVTHGDVPPADPSKWVRSPFTVDTESEPGWLIGRGVEDDKGPIALALYAMKALEGSAMTLSRRVELIISYTEESDWKPFQDFLAAHSPPQLNVALDSQYPVVVAEKGFGGIRVTIPATGKGKSGGGPALISFRGGAFLTQIPEDAYAEIAFPTAKIEQRLLAAARRFPDVRFSFTPGEGSLSIDARGKAAHSSEPWAGHNAITHLAALLGEISWEDSAAARAVRFANDLVGLGDYGERFGSVAYDHPFMGPLTLSLTLLEPQEGGGLLASINFRRPVGRSGDEVKESLRKAFDGWKKHHGLAKLNAEYLVTEPFYSEGAPQVPVLLDIFEHYTGRENPKALSIGGGTHARLVPNGVNFGPSMPGEDYTGHTEHEVISVEQFELNLKMYTAMLVELAATP